MLLVSFGMLVASLTFAVYLARSVLGLLTRLVLAELVAKAAVGEPAAARLGAVGIGLLGSFLGTAVLGDLGPHLFGVPLGAAFLGSTALTGVTSLLLHLATFRPAS